MEELAALANEAEKSLESEHVVPVTILSGFLGAGKTTLLKQILENKQGMRIGVIVNDLAAINIDAALIKTSQSANETVQSIQLENGCICCSAADELFRSLEIMMANAIEKEDYHFDHIIVECTGVAEPKQIWHEFENAAINEDFHLVKFISISRIVTVVDSSTFLDYFSTNEIVKDCEKIESDDTVNNRKVVSLMTEQLECADLIILNKISKLGKDDHQTVKQIIKAINDDANCETCDHCKLNLDVVLPKEALKNPNELRVSKSFDQIHKGLLESANKIWRTNENNRDDIHDDCKNRKDGSRHNHHSGENKSNPLSMAGCINDNTKPIGSQSEAEHNHNCTHDDTIIAASVGKRVGHHSCTSGDSKKRVAIDETCDCSNNDSQPEFKRHKHDNHGLESFVYKRRRPFQHDRLFKFVQLFDSPLEKRTNFTLKHYGNVIRSKGFCWIMNENGMTMYWSHTASDFQIQKIGSWWADVPKEHWPKDEEGLQYIQKDFVEPWGDRRQEIIFIGIDLKKEDVIKQLDKCLATDDEMKALNMHEKKR